MEGMRNVKVGDIVVVLEAYPPKHNGEIGTVKEIYEYGTILVLLHSVGYRWECQSVRLVTLLEKELAEL